MQPFAAEFRLNGHSRTETVHLAKERFDMKPKVLLPFLLYAAFLLGNCAPVASPGAQDFGTPAIIADASSTPQDAVSTQTNRSFDCLNIEEIPAAECRILVAFYESTNGDHWEAKAGWLANETPCTWYGVNCEQGHVNRLYLTHNQLSGSIPAGLGDLSSLNELDLSFNQLTGSIPGELADLTGLYRLDLSYNRLTGAVPAALTEAPIPDLGLWGNQIEGTVWALDGTVSAVEYRGVKFRFDPSLAQSVWPEIVAARPPINGEFDWSIRPEHIRFTFASHPEPDRFQGGGLNISGYPQILIYPTQTFSAMDDSVKGKIEALQKLVKARPAAPENEIPVLPLINAAQVFHVQVQYLDFQNGSGVRFITHYSQEDVSRVTKDNIFYTFQGLTQDGSHYVAVYFPISTAGLPAEPVDEDWDSALARLAATRGDLDSLPADKFEPDLEVLDSVIQSLTVSSP